ncbi:VOC family protein [Lachnospiraceae bacterium 62-26]
MEISHILYKVDNLKVGAELFEDRGFKVEYGSPKNPHNALVYFNDGSYIEIIQNMGFTKPLAFILRKIGYKDFVDGMLKQENSPEGYIRIAFENEDDSFFREKSILDQLGQKSVIVPIKRKDIKGDVLQCKCLFPFNASYPFVKSKFLNFSERDIKHPNGAVGIGAVEYHTSWEIIDYIERLGGCTNLKLQVGDEKIDVNFIYA